MRICQAKKKTGGAEPRPYNQNIGAPAPTVAEISDSGADAETILLTARQSQIPVTVRYKINDTHAA